MFSLNTWKHHQKASWKGLTCSHKKVTLIINHVQWVWHVWHHGSWLVEPAELCAAYFQGLLEPCLTLIGSALRKFRRCWDLIDEDDWHQSLPSISHRVFFAPELNPLWSPAKKRKSQDLSISPAPRRRFSVSTSDRLLSSCQANATELCILTQIWNCLEPI